MAQPPETKQERLTEGQERIKINLPPGDCRKHGFKNAQLVVEDGHCELHVAVDAVRLFMIEEKPELQNIAILYAEGEMPGEKPDPHELKVATSVDGTILIIDSRFPSPSINGLDAMGVVAPDHPLYKAFVTLACESVGLFAPYVPQEQKAVFETMQTSLTQRNAALNPPEAA